MSSRSERVFNTLVTTDPGFKTLTNMLYGFDVPAEDVYADVFKADPGAPPQSNHLLRKIALASTIAGAAVAAGGVGEGLGVERAGAKLVPTGKGIQPGKLALSSAALSGDAITTSVLDRKSTPAQQPQPVAKYNLQEHVAGLIKGAKAAQEPVQPPTQAPVAGTNQLSMFDHKLNPAGEAGKTVGELKLDARATKLAAIRTNPLAAAKKLVNTKPKAAVAAAVGVEALHHRPRRSAGMTDQAYYAKRDEPTRDFVAEGTFSKVDADKRLAFGWASVVEKNGMPVVDRQGDYMTLDDVEDAAYRYVISSRIGGDMHKRNGDQPHHVSDLVESMVVTVEKLERLGVPGDVAKSMPTGWWVGFKIHDDDTWDLVKEGKRAGFSIHGKGRRSLHDLDDAMGY